MTVSTSSAKARLIRAGANNDISAEPLTIRDLMLATVLFASALALARWVPSPDGKEMGTPGFVLFLAAATISTITLLPASSLLLRTRRFQHGVLFGCVYAVFWMALPWVVALIAQYQGLFAAPPVAFLFGLSCARRFLSFKRRRSLSDKRGCGGRQT